MKYCAVIVTYYPDIASFESMEKVLGGFDIEMIVVDNTPEPKWLSQPLEGRFLYYPMGDNIGIAAAQNYGVRVALKMLKDAVFLFDQDSEITHSMINNLIRAFEEDVAPILAPVCLDGNNAEIPFFLINKYGMAVKTKATSSYSSADLVIASGCLVRSSVFSSVGLFDEELFIDYVDFDWCFRCRSMGINTKVVLSSKMRHSIGLGIIGSRKMRTNKHGPFRTYYKVRNPLLLMRKSYIPKNYCIYEVFLSLKSLMVTIVYGPDRIEHLYRGLLGLFNGIFKTKNKKVVDV